MHTTRPKRKILYLKKFNIRYQENLEVDTVDYQCSDELMATTNFTLCGNPIYGN